MGEYNAIIYQHNQSVKVLTASLGGWSVIEEELEKCVLVCANCYREIELGVRQLPANCLQRRIKSVE